jgi:REP element-mobilizing transposase RayT
MRSRYKVNDTNAAHFITSSILEWLPLFTTAACCEILLESFSFCRQHKGLRVFGWVILPNHFHAIVDGPNLSGTVADLKKFTARRLLEQLASENRQWLLNQLAYFREHHKTSGHQVWQEGFHPQAIMSDAMMLQKLEYLHNNPVRAGFVASPEHWRFSSAHEWLPGALPVMTCDQWR